MQVHIQTLLSKGLIQTRLGGQTAPSLIIENHMTSLKCIYRKHKLFSTVMSYCVSHGINPWSILPKTYIVRGSNLDVELDQLLTEKRRSLRGFEVPMIVKPGENSN